jgi:hypothetical protein
MDEMKMKGYEDEMKMKGMKMNENERVRVVYFG